MPTTDVNLADRSGNLVESHKNYDPRIILYYFILAGMLIALAVGLGYQQLYKTNEYRKDERQQNQRRIVMPGSRGNIYDRNGNLLVGNRARFSVRLQVDQLIREIRREQTRIRNRYAEVDDKDVPSYDQRLRIARVAIVQRYLDEINAILGRNEKVDALALNNHFNRDLLLPYTLIEDLSPEEYAHLLERLPVNSLAQIYTFSTREYPYGSAASHVLGYVGQTEDIVVDSEALPGEGLKTFKMKGTEGRAGVESKYDSQLQGEAGGAVFRVTPTGTRLNPPIAVLPPKQGNHVNLSLDIDMQMAAEKILGEYQLAGAAVALDANTGEVLVLASKPDYDLTQFSPRITKAAWDDAIERGALYPRALSGLYPPGSAFKVLVTIAGLRTGNITVDSIVNCQGHLRVGNRDFDCHDRVAHGPIDVLTALEKSCNVFFYQKGLEIGPEAIAAEAKRFHLDQPTGIELPAETRGMIIPDPEWKARVQKEKWLGGDTVMYAIGQSFIQITPLQMACFAASVARDEVWTQPSLIHDPARPRQQTERTGLTPDQRALLIHGMEKVALTGTAKLFQNAKVLSPLTGLTIAAKTGTAQKQSPKGMINFAWLVCFAPVENPQIAIAVAIEGDTPGEETGGGRYATPVAHAILKTWLDKKNQPTLPRIQLKSE